ncbi:MAG TPA: glycosyltransferase [Candidatus Sumerlaeota bacterium]|nr:glycosyltransferase [Candidatus Sumerlaeota bacterium]
MPTEKARVTGACRHVVIVGERFTFPQGMANTKRVRLLARGLRENGVETSVLVIRALDRWDQPLNTEREGVDRGVPYEYSTGTPIRSRSFWGRRFQDIRGFIQSVWRLWQLRRAGRLDAVFLYTLDYATVRWFSFWCRILGVPVILEVCEWPLDVVSVHGGDLDKSRHFCMDAWKWVTGVVLISEALEEKIREGTRNIGRVLPLCRIPILVDPAEYEGARAETNECVLLCSGALAYRNITRMIVRACGILRGRGLSFKVRFTGRASESERAVLFEAADSEGITDRVEYVGFVSDEEVARLYRQATLLLAPLPDDPQSVTRFPTKLGEYLASGRPVVTTTIGEPGRYLQDGVTAFLIREGSAEALADKIGEAVSDPERAEAVGLAGQVLARTEFHYAVQGKRLAAFFQEVTAGRGALE